MDDWVIWLIVAAILGVGEMLTLVRNRLNPSDCASHPMMSGAMNAPRLIPI